VNPEERRLIDLLSARSPSPHGVVLRFLLLLLLSSHAVHPVWAAEDKVAEEENIRLVVIRKQMEEWAQGADQSEAEAKDETEKCVAAELNFKVFFVSISDKDPSDKFIERLRDIPRIIKKVSASEISKAVRMPVVDKITRQRGIIFSADRIRWLGKNSVEVEGGYHCDGLCGAGITFRVGREKGKWVVISERVNWIS
jgi:hypothetical protein